MTHVLQLNNSIFGGQGQSSQLVDRFLQHIKTSRTEVKVTQRDLALAPVPHLTGERFQAILTATEERNEQQSQEAKLADNAIEELEAADVLLITAPVYNFNLTSTLKAWFDHIARAGRTFEYTENGPQGLLKGKTAYVFVTSGGQYAGTDLDFQTPYIKHMLNFIGITDVHIIRAEGLAMGDQASNDALEAAHKSIEGLVA